MPKYHIITRQVTEREYEYPMELPVDMGSSTERLTDRMMRTVADQGAIDTSGLNMIGTAGICDEEITTVYRDSEQIWPRLRHGSKKKATPVPQLAMQTQIPEKLGDDDEEGEG